MTTTTAAGSDDDAAAPAAAAPSRTFMTDLNGNNLRRIQQRIGSSGELARLRMAVDSLQQGLLDCTVLIDRSSPRRGSSLGPPAALAPLV